MSNSNLLEVGKRVWTESGLYQHGPATGPKTDVPPKTGGVITHIGSSGIFSGPDLYAVRWDLGQQTRHYYAELLCIGSFHTLDDFRQAVRHGSDARVTLGPRGGFREGFMTVPTAEGPMSIHIGQDHAFIWRSIIEPILVQRQLPIHTTRLERKKPMTKARREEIYNENMRLLKQIRQKTRP